MKLLFVCTGNTCRSSMAGAIAAREMERAGLPEAEVRSAGTSATPGRPASENAVAVMGEAGIDLGSHRSSVLDRETVAWADLVLAMTAGHRREALRICPGAAGKVYTLAGFAGEDGDIPDPYGGGPEDYRRTAARLSRLISLAVERIIREKRRGG